MGFLSGLITGAATSVDAQLKKDIERSQERAEGMAQYRITRRRAEVERQEKEKRELKETLGNLASLVDGDIDKAAQLYKAGGGNITGANALFTELKKNADAGKDIKTAITFAEARAEPGQMTDYINQFITPISKLPPVAGVKGAGLYGAIFKPDLSARVQQQVDEAAPIPAQEAKGMDVQMATIDRTGFLAAEDYGEVRKERERAGAAEKRAVAAEERAATGFVSAEERYESAEARAVAAEKRAAAAFSTDQDIKKAQEARAKAEEERRVAEETRKAQEFVSRQKLTGLSIEEKEIALMKEKDHPEFASFEKMAVYASTKLNTKGLTTDQRNTFEKMRDDAIAGARRYQNAIDDEGTVAGGIEFSKQSLDSIVQGAAKFELDMVPSKAIGDRIKYTIDGNEAAYYGGMARALNTVEKRLTAQDGTINPQAKRYIDNLRASNTQKLYNYATDQMADKLTGDTRRQDRSKFIDFNTVSAGAAEVKSASTDALTDAQALKQWARNNAPVGSVIPMNESGTLFGIWTGSRFLKAQDMGLE